jgi:hypothetical protein
MLSECINHIDTYFVLRVQLFFRYGNFVLIKRCVCDAKKGPKINSTGVVSLLSADRKSDVGEQNSPTSASVGRMFAIVMELDFAFLPTPHYGMVCAPTHPYESPST